MFCILGYMSSGSIMSDGIYGGSDSNSQTGILVCRGWGGEMAQLVKCLLFKHENLDLIPNTNIKCLECL